MATKEEVLQALATVNDPEIGRPITELDMVKNVTVDDDIVVVEILLTVAGCPLKDKITKDVTAAVAPLSDVSKVHVEMGVMTDEQRQAMVSRLRSGQGEQGAIKEIPFWGQDRRTKAILVSSGKGGVGKSSVTANLAVALAQQGHNVGVIDCDVWGFSIPRMMGVSGRPTAFDGMILPLEAHGVKVISMGFFIPDDQPVIWRGPMLHKAINQFLADVYWGDLDFVLLDLPPGTGDVSISLAQFLPGADMLIVTTPQEAAQKVAARAGRMTEQVPLKIIGVIENMSYFVCPDCDSTHRIFGEGGGEQLAKTLGTELLGEVPIQETLREGADIGTPIVALKPESPAAQALQQVAAKIAANKPSIKGKRLPLFSK
ncbi:MAG TPA: Mrp/NBP35 family ATP-binding protein [Actinomycetota bacterium]|nr:Mrp/NBP35 family ATP-binding protein [Actinomycetota bacterium]